MGEVLGELDAIVLQLQQQKREVAAKRHEQQLEASRWRAEHDELRAEGDAARRARAAAEEAAAAAAAEAAALRAERQALEAEGASLREQQSALSAERAALRQEVWQSQQTARAEEMARREAEEKRRHQLEASVRSQLSEITASRLSLCLKHADATPTSDALGAWRQHCAMRRGEADGRARRRPRRAPAALRRLVVALDAASLGAAVRAWGRARRRPPRPSAAATASDGGRTLAATSGRTLALVRRCYAAEKIGHAVGWTSPWWAPGRAFGVWRRAAARCARRRRKRHSTRCPPKGSAATRPTAATTAMAAGPPTLSCGLSFRPRRRSSQRRVARRPPSKGTRPSPAARIGLGGGG